MGPLRWPVGPLQLSFFPLAQTSSYATACSPSGLRFSNASIYKKLPCKRSASAHNNVNDFLRLNLECCKCARKRSCYANGLVELRGCAPWSGHWSRINIYSSEGGAECNERRWIKFCFIYIILWKHVTFRESMPFNMVCIFCNRK